MSEFCPHCGAELRYVTFYGTGNYSAYEKYGYGYKKLGDIYQCPNHECFDDPDEALAYIKNTGGEIAEQSTDDVACQSGIHGGYFHIYEGENQLREGNPC